MRISDWSSDVCSSDLESAWAQVLDGHGLARADLVERGVVLVLLAEEGGETAAEIGALALVRWWPVNHGTSRPLPAPAYCASRGASPLVLQRSEERRVGKEGFGTCRSRWSPSH